MSNKKINENKTLNKIDATQLKNSANSVNVVKELEDAPSAFVENGISYPDNEMNVFSFPEFAPYPESNRFSKKLHINSKKIKEE